jgi:hypothetical protein
MKSLLSIVLSLCLLLSCSGGKEKYPETALDAGRSFIRASLNGDFEKARTFMLRNDENAGYFDSFRRYYDRLPEQEKENYRKASYEINKITEVNDSATLINYSNSYMHKAMDILVVRKEGKWMIDFRYTYRGTATP